VSTRARHLILLITFIGPIVAAAAVYLCVYLVDRRAATNALTILKELETVTTAGINYAQFQERLLNATVRFHQVAPDRLDVIRSRYGWSVGNWRPCSRAWSPLFEAEKLYLLSSKLWNADILGHRSSMRFFARHALIACPRLDPKLEREFSDFLLRDDPDYRRLRSIPRDVPEPDPARFDHIRVPAIWGCASTKLQEAEGALRLW
jgi:hypothetical protein